MKKLHLVMPMGGAGTRFGNFGFNCPKPLIELSGEPFFYWAARSVSKYVDLATITFVVLQDHVDHFFIDDEIRKYYPDAYIEVLEKVLPGAVLTCMKGARHLPDDEPVLFNDCDHSFQCNSFNRFCENGFRTGDLEPDGALLTFKSREDKFSYAEFGEDGLVTRTVEKEAISSSAICGAYYFKNKDVFLKNAEEYLTKCEYNEFFMSGVYNIMCSHGLKVTSFCTDKHFSFGTPEEYKDVMWSFAY